jgi:Uma2 family endonuclease
VAAKEGAAMNLIPRPHADDVDYPTSDGKPMAETDTHRQIMVETINVLQQHYASDPMVYVTGNLLLFYAEGDRRRHVSPDVMVVRGVPNVIRENYLLWQEGRGPDVVFEITSSSTRREDTGRKMDLYRDTLRVSELFLVDPYGDWLNPQLQGFRLRAGQYQPIRPAADGHLVSRGLGLHVVLRERPVVPPGRGRRNRLRHRVWVPRFIDPATGQELQTDEELRIREAERANREAERANREAERADREAAEAERLRRELEALRRQRRR